jgi:uncharacterized protein YprB with RNaseH-like and TPR domain
MTTLAERLRGVIGTRPAEPGPCDEQPGGEGGVQPAHAPEFAADVLGGRWFEANGHRYLVVDRTYTSDYRLGRVSVAESLPPWPQWRVLGGRHPEPTEQQGPDRSAPHFAFIDLETTGLAGGAGTYAFLVGVAWFDGDTFRTRQYFLSSYTAERTLLDGFVADVAGAGAVVTYNGKSFDLPLIETRCALHRMKAPLADRPHIDMLHPARRLWRADDELGEPGSCRLATLEETLCGHRRVGDVPGCEIPSRYFHFVRTGDARPLDAVFEHNRLDLLALALVTARAARLLEEGPSGARSAREALGLGWLYERAGRTRDALASYARGAGAAASQHAGGDRAESLSGNEVTRAEALRAFALLARRGRKYADAAGAWRRVLALRACPHTIAREATEALAVHHEHRVRDLEEARRFALQSLQMRGSLSREQATRHRLGRLNRKLGDTPRGPLF